MAAVFFAHGAWPDLSESEALELAELLAQRRSLAAHSAATQIHEQVIRDVTKDELSHDIRLTEDEQAEVLAVLNEGRWPAERQGFARLRDELTND